MFIFFLVFIYFHFFINNNNLWVIIVDLYFVDFGGDLNNRIIAMEDGFKLGVRVYDCLCGDIFLDSDEYDEPIYPDEIDGKKIVKIEDEVYIDGKNIGDYDNALDYYERSLTIAEELGDKRGMGQILMAIGNVHFEKSDYDKALDYYERSLAIQEEIGDKSGMGYSIHNIGIVHYYKGEIGRAHV